MNAFQDYAMTIIGTIATSIIFTVFVSDAISDLINMSTQMVSIVKSSTP